MTHIPWQLTPNIPGGRGIERPFIQRKLEGIRHAVIVDYGCIDKSDEQAFINTSVYCPDPSNRLIGVDGRHIPHLRGQYVESDICSAPILAESVDIGLCVSVIEHIGTGAYACDVKADRRDELALAAMASHLKRASGVLYLTFPVGPSAYVIDNWIRVYTPAQIKAWNLPLPDLRFELELFKLVNGSWYSCSEAELCDVVHYTVGTDINAIGALTLCWKH